MGAAAIFTAAFRAAAADLAAARRAAATIDRRDAQEAMFGLLFDLAASDAIGSPEWDLLEELRRLWRLEIEAPPG